MFLQQALHRVGNCSIPFPSRSLSFKRELQIGADTFISKHQEDVAIPFNSNFEFFISLFKQEIQFKARMLFQKAPGLLWACGSIGMMLNTIGKRLQGLGFDCISGQLG